MVYLCVYWRKYAEEKERSLTESDWAGDEWMLGASVQQNSIAHSETHCSISNSLSFQSVD